MSSPTVLRSAHVRREVNGRKLWSCLKQCPRQTCVPTSSATMRQSVHVIRGVNGRKLWSCLKQFRRQTWVPMSLATVRPSVHVSRVVIGRQLWFWLKRCEGQGLVPMLSATVRRSVHVRSGVIGRRLWSYSKLCSRQGLAPMSSATMQLSVHVRKASSVGSFDVLWDYIQSNPGRFSLQVTNSLQVLANSGNLWFSGAQLPISHRAFLGSKQFLKCLLPATGLLQWLICWGYLDLILKNQWRWSESVDLALRGGHFPQKCRWHSWLKASPSWIVTWAPNTRLQWKIPPLVDSSPIRVWFLRSSLPRHSPAV